LPRPRRCRWGRTPCGPRTRRSRVDVLHVHPHVRNGLRAIHQRLGPARWAISTISLTGTTVPSAFDTWVTDTILVRSFSSFGIHPAAPGRCRPPGSRADLGALGGGELLPGHDVGVVLQVADDDLVALARRSGAPALGDQVDALGGAAHKDDRSRSGALMKRRTFLRAPIRRRPWRGRPVRGRRGGCWSSRAGRNTRDGR
jgi:hypothetical protein